MEPALLRRAEKGAFGPLFLDGPKHDNEPANRRTKASSARDVEWIFREGAGCRLERVLQSYECGPGCETALIGESMKRASSSRTRPS